MKTFWTRCLKCNAVIKVLAPKGSARIAPQDCLRCDH